MIEVNRNSIIIRNVDTASKEYKNLVFKLSLYDKVQHRYTFSAFVQDENDLYIPSSVTLKTIESIFPKEEISVNYNKIAKAKSVSYRMIHAPKNDLQQNAIKFLMKMKNDPESHQRFLSLETRIRKNICNNKLYI